MENILMNIEKQVLKYQKYSKIILYIAFLFYFILYMAFLKL